MPAAVFSRYLTENPFFMLTFLLSRIPVWAVILAVLYAGADPVSSALLLLLVLISRSYVEHTVFGSSPLVDAFKRVVWKPATYIFGVTVFIVVYPFLIVYILTGEQWDGLLVLLALLMLVLYRVSYPKQESWSYKSGLLYRLPAAAIWLYIIFAGEHPEVALVMAFGAVLLESAGFLRRYEGIL
ncbi:hypothetical protein [Limisalsivibrio acetivorans]|uniref:hypothetical protein n=1 Tax=Limisalsivibrio acetivorans TaxID=1304888 RepID=UPI0003B5DDBC|nr:hypothetical protein [Limisalsivibrio acetivorans]